MIQTYKTTHRFEAMDGLRGVAALAVVLQHSSSTVRWLPNFQLAVDFFFILSGFVISHSYSKRLVLGGMSIKQFLTRRFIRLYPMLFIGATGGILIALIHNHTNPEAAYSGRMVFSSGALSLFVLPYLVPISTHYAFSFNPPMWSLFFEIVANGLYGATARWLKTSNLTLVIVSGLSVVIWHGLGGGVRLTFCGASLASVSVFLQAYCYTSSETKATSQC